MATIVLAMIENLSARYYIGITHPSIVVDCVRVIQSGSTKIHEDGLQCGRPGLQVDLMVGFQAEKARRLSAPVGTVLPIKH